MCRAFQNVEQFPNIVVAEAVGQTELARSDAEGLSRRALCGHQSETKEVVDHFFERSAGSPAFLVEKAGDVVIERQSGSHIMMLLLWTS